MITNTDTSVYEYFEGFEDPKFYINLYQIKACSGSKIKDARILLIVNNCEEDSIQLTRQAAFAAHLNNNGRKIQMLIEETETNRAILSLRKDHTYPIHEWSTEGMSLDTAQTKLDQACEAAVDANLSLLQSQNEGEIKENAATQDKCRRTMKVLNTLKCFQDVILDKAKKLGSNETLVCIGSPTHFQESTLKALKGYTYTVINFNATPLNVLKTFKFEFNSKVFLVHIPGSFNPIFCSANLVKNPDNAKIGRNLQFHENGVKFINETLAGMVTVSADKEYTILSMIENKELEELSSMVSGSLATRSGANNPHTA